MSTDWMFEAVKSFCLTHAAQRGQPLRRCAPVSREPVLQAQTAADHLVAAQRGILASMLKEMDHGALLDLLKVPRALAPWIGLLEDPQAELPMIRADVLLDERGQLNICEINVDSGLGVMEACEFLRIERFGSTEPVPESPLEAVARLLANALARTGARKVCVLDTSEWVGQGFFSPDWMLQVLRSRLPGVDVFTATEIEGFERVDASTVVFRMFLAPDALADLPFVHALFERAGEVVCDFSGELMGSKVWLALLHDPAYRSWLNDEQRAAIDRFLPYTKLVTSDTVPELLDSKDRWFFKAAVDFGGKGVVAGHACTVDALRQTLLSNSSNGEWIAQHAVSLKPFPLLLEGRLEPVPCNSVLGMYRIGDSWCEGVLVRAMETETVVNVSRGANFGWGYLVENV